MRRYLLSILLALLVCSAASGQQALPDYVIRSLRQPRFSDDNSQVFIEFVVANQGAAASSAATVLLFTGAGEEITRQAIAPLAADSSQAVTLSFPASRFPSGSTQSLQIVVGVDEVEPSESETIENNFGRVSVTLPTSVQPLPQTTAEPAPIISAEGQRISILGVSIDLADRESLALVVGLVGGALLLLILFVLFLRLLFRRPPTFGAWQPPYAQSPWLDPNTMPGRRQGWQPHAQNDLPPPPSTGEGAAHARKLLTSIDGRKLANWQVTGMRLCQYDQYGRITRTQAVAPKRLLRRLNGTFARSASPDQSQLERRLRPVARALSSTFARKMSARSVTLPIALDLHFQGVHGEVRIVFELYVVQYGQWRRIDQWEPEMNITDKTLHELYTYTIYGQRSNESWKMFRQRMQQDVVFLLAQMVMPEQPSVGEENLRQSQ